MNETWMVSFYWILIALTIAYIIFGLDDLFVDIMAWGKRLRPRLLSGESLGKMRLLQQKKIAVIVPAWKEGHIIRKMLEGNERNIRYQSYHIFVGVYPNDTLTYDEVRAAAFGKAHLHAVVNDRPGPSSKGQILNHVIESIFIYEREHGITFDAFLMQDAEDIIHPDIFTLVNAELNQNDFIQTPVFSLSVRKRNLVAGTYVAEFAEHHTKDILVRNALGAAVPSAGVGTALSRRLVKAVLGKYGALFNEGSLTEDYELGHRVHALGFRSHFACCYYQSPQNEGMEFIATREYFPKYFIRSIKQKTRWSLGIVLQGWRNIGWFGSLANRYFLYRDRKGIGVNILVLVGYLCFIVAALEVMILKTFDFDPTLQVLMSTNMALMLNRVLQRMVAVSRVYGITVALCTPFTLPVANLINAIAGMRALKQDSVSRLTKRAVAWSKTEHELPAFFGEKKAAEV